MVETEWYEDAEQAGIESKVQAKPNDAAPHWIRCDFYNAEHQRCRLASGHPGDHMPSKP